MNLFRRNPRPATIETLYGAIVAQARIPVFYRAYGVPDTRAGRLDLLMLHLALAYERLAQGPEQAKALGQAVFDRFCRDMDDHLREDGVSDLKVPRQMRKVASAFLGRHAAYISALKTGDRAALEAALTRNVYQGDGRQSPEQLATYARAAYARLLAQDLPGLTEGKPDWPDPTRIGDAAAETAGLAR